MLNLVSIPTNDTVILSRSGGFGKQIPNPTGQSGLLDKKDDQQMLADSTRKVYLASLVVLTSQYYLVIPVKRSFYEKWQPKANVGIIHGKHR